MKLKTYALGLLAGLAVTFITATAAMADTPTVSSVGKKVICQCGCTLILTNCNHGECGPREEMNTIIANQISAGKSEGDIIGFFVDRYGPQVLASPSKSGFNLTAWVLPFAVLAGGGGILYYLIHSWVRRGQTAEASTAPEMAREREGYSQRLARDLEKFEQR
ncbi:MAG: cytochrome c-type biogenesis protein CcmH [Dehalococcoidia bacterium]|nr:cytochrome c-type biogenesis protein CcmH [Dehalococcoidia bacterium]